MTTVKTGVRTTIIWLLRVLAAALFLFAASMKMSGQQMMVAEFHQIGLGQWFRYFTGLIEVLGGVAVLTPRFSGVGAVVLLFVDVGALIAQFVVLHGDWIHTIVIGAVLCALIALQRKRSA